ncbi:MAG: Gfo/Idh/MocA family oxidoreductase [Clostridia bacterium]|nr:Gfo/Idh/MocA family oxidoreductase [Clostridia bacterium]
MGINKIYNLGIIGYGGMAGNHNRQLSQGNVRVRIKGVYDIDGERMQVAKEQGYIAYESKEALLSDPEIDIVLVATTNDSHKSLAIEALRAGKHVICEKPVTMSSEELVEIMDVAKECGRVFTVDQNRRFNRDFINVWRTIDSGVIGKPYVIESRVEGSRGMPEGWRTTKALGGGMMYDWGVHLIDQVMYMTKEKVTNIFCKMYYINYSEVEDNFRLTMTFESGLTAHIEISTNNFITHPRFYVLGTEGTMVVTDWDGTGKVVKKLCDDNTWGTEIKTVKAGPTKTMAPRDPSTVEVIELTEPKDVRDNLDPVYEQLVDAIEGKELLIKPEETLRVMKVMEAAFESAAKGIAINTEI